MHSISGPISRRRIAAAIAVAVLSVVTVQPIDASAAPRRVAQVDLRKSAGPAAASIAQTGTPARRPEPDAGAADPAEFPRPTGLVRRSYNRKAGDRRTEEVATYHSTAEMDDIAARYHDALVAAGWKEGARSDSGLGPSRLSMIDWNLPTREAEIRLYGVRTGGTDLWIRVFTYPAALAGRATTTSSAAPIAASPTQSTVAHAAEKSAATGAAPLGPPPTYIHVNPGGDAATHEVIWQAADKNGQPWVSADVMRDGPDGWVTLAEHVNTSVFETAFVPRNTTFRVSVHYRDGSVGTGDYVWANPPAPDKVMNLKADCPAPGSLHIGWDRIYGTRRTRVFVSTGSPAGNLVYASSVTLTNLPAGACNVRVVPVYGQPDGPEVPGPGSASVDTTVRGAHVRYRIVILGLECVHQTYDDPLQLDGKGDEVFAGAYWATAPPPNQPTPPPAHRPPGAIHGGDGITLRHGDYAPTVPPPPHSIPPPSANYRNAKMPTFGGLVRTKVMGDTNGFPDRILAGTLSSKGGIQTGDFVPSSACTTAQPGVTGLTDRFPLLAWEGELRDGGDLVVITPVLFEWDDGKGAPWRAWADWWSTPNGSRILGERARRAAHEMSDQLFVPLTDPEMENGKLNGRVYGPEFLLSGDRPIGLDDQNAAGVLSGPEPVWTPRGIVLTRGLFEAALGDSDAVVVPYVYNDATPPATQARLEGQYILYIQFEGITAQPAVRP